MRHARALTLASYGDGKKREQQGSTKKPQPKPKVVDGAQDHKFFNHELLVICHHAAGLASEASGVS